nr:MAG TPA: hypothetical protein [Microviridae sp.]
MKNYLEIQKKTHTFVAVEVTTIINILNILQLCKIEKLFGDTEKNPYICRCRSYNYY